MSSLQFDESCLFPYEQPIERVFLSKLVILKVCIYRLMLDNIFCELFSPENILFLKMTNSLSFLIDQPVEGVFVLC